MTRPRRPTLLARLSKDRRAASAVEFALVAPVMISMFFGAAELSLLLSADRKVTQTASTITDLVAQDDAITSSEMTDIFAASRAVMEPFDNAVVCMRVTSVVMPTANNAQVGWVRQNGCSGAAPAAGSPVTGVNSLLSVGGSLIRGEITYTYSSPISLFFRTNLTLSDTFYLRPRRGAQVTVS